MDLSISDGACWSGHLTLPSWAGYQSRQGRYGAVYDGALSDGRVTLYFAPEGRGIEPLNGAEIGLISWFEQHEMDVSAAVKAAILSWCAPDNLERLRDFDFDDTFPTVAGPDDLKPLIGLHKIFVHQLDDGGLPYVGYEFECDWEPEHGLGVLMLGTRLIEVGFADTAFHLWVAEVDYEQRRQPT